MVRSVRASPGTGGRRRRGGAGGGGGGGREKGGTVRASAARSTWCGGICEQERRPRGDFSPGVVSSSRSVPPVFPWGRHRGTSSRPSSPLARGGWAALPPLPFFFPFFSPFPRLDSGGAKATDRVEVEELAGLVRVRNGPSIQSSLRVCRSLIRFKLLPCPHSICPGASQTHRTRLVARAPRAAVDGRQACRVGRVG